MDGKKSKTDELMDEERAQKYVDSLPVLKEGQTFCFDCNPDVACFGRCCRALTLPLTPYDVLRLVRRLKMPSQKFLNMYTTIRTLPDSGFPIPMLNMRPGPNEECPFVTPGGCDITSFRRITAAALTADVTGQRRNGSNMRDSFPTTPQTTAICVLRQW